MKKILLLLLLVSALSVFYSGCKQVASIDVKIDVTGTLTLPVAAPGKTYVLLFDLDSNPVNGYYRKATGVCGSGTAVPYSVTLGGARNYYIYAYVEIDNAYGQADMKYAGAGDYFGVYGLVYPLWPVSANAVVANISGQVYDISLVAAAANVTGTLTYSTARTAPYYVIVDSDTNYANGFASIASGSSAATASQGYSMLAAFPGTYYAYAVVDCDNDLSINYDAGDELGYYGGASALQPPAAANLVIPAGAGPTTANITLDQNDNNVSVVLKLPAAAAGKNYAVWFSDKFELNAGKMLSKSFSGTCGAGSSVFISGNITAGNYYVFAYVDVSATGTPNEGDYIGVYAATYPQLPSAMSSVPGIFEIEMVTAANNVAGDVTGVGSVAAGTAAYVLVLTDFNNISNTVTGAWQGVCSGNFRYNMFIPFSGTFIVMGFVDVSGTLDYTATGNKLGFAGNSGMFPYIPVTTPNISIDIKKANEVDIPVGEIPAI